MSNIRNVQWVPGKPEAFRPGMILEMQNGDVHLVGTGTSSIQLMGWRFGCKRWAWLIQPHELAWLEDMASRKTRTQE